MKMYMLALIIIVATAFTADDMEISSDHHTQGDGPLSIDGTAYSQTWDVDLATHGFSIYGAGDRWVCDDFVLDSEWEVQQVDVWMIWLGEMGTSMNIVFSEDNGSLDPNNATTVWSEAVPSENIFADEWTSSGGTLYDIYKVTCTINTDIYPILSGGVTYWMEIQADVVDNCFVMISDNYVGSSCWYNDGSGLFAISDEVFGYDSDMFFDLYGDILSLESGTWGDIKSLF